MIEDEGFALWIWNTGDCIGQWLLELFGVGIGDESIRSCLRIMFSPLAVRVSLLGT